MKDERLAKLIGEEIAVGRGAVDRLYIHSDTGAINTKEGWIESYDPEELEDRGLTADQAFAEDDEVTLWGADIWEGEIEGRKLRVIWPDDCEAHEIDIMEVSE